ncbi:hypothetical protein PTKU46_43120 [Paraburkholderia terrae]|uniref:hypothetical protein n=1 Tax=Paraburkholderia terrae TaxID=311230 RepID=UPI0030DE65A3
MLGLLSGSMRLKVQAAIEFAGKTGKDAVIIVAITQGRAGARIGLHTRGIGLYPPA